MRGSLLCFALALPSGLSLSLAPATRSSVRSSPARAVARMAYNPQPSKGRPRKAKSRDPAEKVKGAQSAAASLQLVPEQTFWEGPPSITETIIPGLSLFTVVGVIPFGASLARQAWTRYKLTNKRLEVKSGFQGKDVVQITWREVTDVKWLRRFGGSAGDCVFTLRDGAKLEMRSLPQFDRNLKFIMDQVGAWKGRRRGGSG
jgi:hypothetical protein